MQCIVLSVHAFISCRRHGNKILCYSVLKLLNKQTDNNIGDTSSDFYKELCHFVTSNRLP